MRQERVKPRGGKRFRKGCLNTCRADKGSWKSCVDGESPRASGGWLQNGNKGTGGPGNVTGDEGQRDRLC